MSNRLALNRYMHDAAKPNNPAAPSYMVQDFVDEVTGYDAGANAKYEHDSVQITPQSGLVGVFQSAVQPVQYDINAQPLSHYDRIQLRLELTNNGAANATLLAGQFLINFIEVMVSGDTIETIYPHHLMANDLYRQYSDEDVFNNRSLRGFVGGIQGTVFAGSATVLAPAASRIIFVEIPCVFSKTKCFVSAIKQVITFRVHYNSTALTSTSLATTINLTTANMIIDGRRYDDVIRRQLLLRYQQYDHVFGYYDQQRNIISGQAISNTTRTTVPNTAFGGYKSALLLLFLVPNAAILENQYSFQAITKLDLFLNGRSVSNFEGIFTDELKATMAEKFYTTSVATENIYAILQSNLPVDSINKGLSRGCVALTNNDQFRIQAAVAATYDVYVLCYRYANFIIMKNGTVSLQPVAAM